MLALPQPPQMVRFDVVLVPSSGIASPKTSVSCNTEPSDLWLALASSVLGLAPLDTSHRSTWGYWRMRVQPHQAPSYTLQHHWVDRSCSSHPPTSHHLDNFFVGPPVDRIFFPFPAMALAGFLPLAPPSVYFHLLPSLLFLHPVVEKFQIQHLASMLVWARGACCQEPLTGLRVPNGSILC